MGRRIINPYLDVHEKGDRMFIINPYRYASGGGDTPILQFDTNKSGTFGASFTINSGTLLWDFGDGTPLVASNSPTRSYPDNTIKTIKVYSNTVLPDNITTAIGFGSYPAIIGSVNLSYFNLSNATVNLNNAGALFTSLTLGEGTVTSLLIQNNTGFNTLSSNNVTLINATVLITHGNVSVLQFKSGSTINILDINGFKGTTLDLSTYTIKQQLLCAGNSNLIEILFSTNPNTLNIVNLYSLANLASINFTNVSLSGSLNMSNVNKLTTITWGTIGQFTSITFQNDKLTQTEVDEVLSIVALYSSANTPTANLAINLLGSIMSAPSSTGLTDKATIESNYTAAGFTATISVNT
jgi:hypothetical protein